MVVQPKGQPIIIGFIGLIMPMPPPINMPPIIIPVIMPMVIPIIGMPMPPLLTTTVLEREPLLDLLLLLRELRELLDLEGVLRELELRLERLPL